jgi:hypothetical protein
MATEQMPLSCSLTTGDCSLMLIKFLHLLYLLTRAGGFLGCALP